MNSQHRFWRFHKTKSEWRIAPTTTSKEVMDPNHLSLMLGEPKLGETKYHSGSHLQHCLSLKWGFRMVKSWNGSPWINAQLVSSTNWSKVEIQNSAPETSLAVWIAALCCVPPPADLTLLSTAHNKTVFKIGRIEPVTCACSLFGSLQRHPCWNPCCSYSIVDRLALRTTTMWMQSHQGWNNSRRDTHACDDFTSDLLKPGRKRTTVSAD